MSALQPNELSYLRVGDWDVWPRLHTLERRDDRRRVSPKAMAILLALAERPGAVCPKDALIAAAWEESFVSDEALAAVLYELRRAFDDDARTPRYVETIRKSGYRLIATVSYPSSSESPAAVAGSVVASEFQATATESASSDTTAGNNAARSSGWARAVAVTIGVALIVAGISFAAHRAVTTVDRPLPPPHSVAVLPVTTFSTPGEDRLAGALTEMLTADLAQVCEAPVTPGIALRSRPTQWGLSDAVELLGVDAVVEGSVLRSGSQVWIAVQLVDTRSGAMLWSATYDRQLGDELVVLREVALDVARQVQALVSAPPPAR